MNIISPDGGERRTSKKETPIAVKDFNLEKQCKTSLKETLKEGIQASDVSPLLTQIAGHGSCDDGLNGMLQHDLGVVLKPIQPPPRGLRELEFYKKISSSCEEEDVKIRDLTPKFYGVETIKLSDGHQGQYLVLENLTFGLHKPCVMDIKIGKITYGLDASQAKIDRESKSYPGTKIPFGFSVLGIISHSDQGFRRLTKAFGKSLDENAIDDILENFLNVNSTYAKNLAQCFLDKLKDVEDFFSTQKSYHVYASSILFAYDYENLDKVDWSKTNPVRVNLIDFAHIFPGDGRIDHNYLYGLQNIKLIFEKFISMKI